MQHPRSPRGMASKLLIVVFVVLIVLPAILLAFINTPPGRTVFSSIATKSMGREVVYTGYIYPTFAWPPALHVSGLTVANSEGGRAQNMAKIGVMEISISPVSLFADRLNVHTLSLVDSELHLERNAKGQPNWEFDSTSATTAEEKPTVIPSLGTLHLQNSVFTYLDVPQKTDIELKGTNDENSFLLKGDGKKGGKPFALSSKIAATCLAQQADPCPVEINFSVGHTALRAKGTLKKVVPPEGADFSVDLKGADAAELFPLLGIALPPTPPYHLKGQLTYEDRRWHFNDFSGTLGESDLRGDVLWDMTPTRPKLTATLFSNKIRFIDLLTAIGVPPEAPLSEEQKAYAAKQEASALVIPDLPLDIGKISSLDADVTFTGKKVISDNLPLDDFYMKFALEDRVMKMTPVKFGTANGDISTILTVDARQTPVNSDADINFDKLALAGLLGKAGSSLGDIQKAEGFIGGRMRLSGHGKSLHEMLSHAHGTAGMAMQGGSISNLLVSLISLDIARSLGFLLTGDEPLAIRCVAATFNVEKGVMNSDSFVIDTADSNIKGEGTVNLTNEQMNMRILPQPKKATLLSLRSPISIEGTLKNPSIALEKGPLATRGAIATGLAVIQPVAAVAALFDSGMGKDSDCATLLKNVTEKTGKKTQTNEVKAP